MILKPSNPDICIVAEVVSSILPFLKPKPQAGASAVTYRKPDESSEPKEEGYQGLKEAMQELAKAVSTGDASKAAEAFKAAFSICESEPHYEDQSFDSSEDTE